MMNFCRKLSTVLVLLITFTVSLNLFAQESAGKKILTMDDYLRWRNISAAVISGDGNWTAHVYSTITMDDTLHIRNLSTDNIHKIPSGSGPVFSDDSKWLGYRINQPVKTVKKLRKENKPVSVKAGLMNLATNEKFIVENVSSFKFAKESGFFAVKKSKTDKQAKHRGTDLLLRNLKTSADELIGSVYQFEFNKSGGMLAYIIDSADSTGNGLYLFDLQTGIRRPLDAGKAVYDRLTWDKEGTAAAALKGKKKSGFVHKDNKLIAFRNLISGEAVKFEYDPAAAFDFPKDMVISENSGLTWSKNLNKIFFGIREQENEVKKSDEPKANVDIFHWKDPRIQTVQKVRAEFDKRFTFRSVFNLNTSRFHRLADETMRNVTLSRDGEAAIGSDNSVYMSDWKESQADYYVVNTGNGERKLFLKGQKRTLGLSPGGNHFLYWKDSHIWNYNLKTGKHLNLTENSPVNFVNLDYDHPGEKPSYGVAGWTKDGKNVILRHKHDFWLQPLDGGAAANLTGGIGSQNEIRFRYISLDPEEFFIDLSKPALFSAYGEWTKKEGFYLLTKGKLEELISADRHFSRLTKAKKADKFMFTSETFRDFPDYYVGDTRFTSPNRITDANPWRSEYKWGNRILFEFQNKDGVRLQGTLAIPDDYKEGRRRPMIVNFYEKKTQELHHFYNPQYKSRYTSGNIGPVVEFAAYVSSGYLVMQPDIHLNTGTTHDDMLDCVEAATRKVIEMGYADPDRIALGGGSFSGGGSAFIATRSKMFKCIASRAAPINLAGEFNILFSGSGQNNHRYDIYGQGRYGTNPFDDFELYRSQSPITHVETMDTPLLYLHGVKDGSVEYLQGMEFYNALRFLEKPIIFLSYPDEGHNLKKIENQKDFTKRLWQFFDHYLKDKPAPDWMIHGVKYLKKNK